MVEISEEMVQQAMDAYNEVGVESDEHRVIIRAALAAALPLIEAAVREECADAATSDAWESNAFKPARDDHE